MDKNAIKKYAVWARRELISRVTQKAYQYGIRESDIVDANVDSIDGRILTDSEKKERRALIMQVQEKGFDQVMEEVAYTWFNRFSALRFMEVNGYLPSHVRVFTDEGNNFKPQIITEAIHMELEGLDMDKVYALKEADNNDELFKYLLITQCNALNEILPGMFQKIADYTELLFPDNLLRAGSVIEQMIALIPEDDWKDVVQIIGWLYQYYNSEPKDLVFANLKKKIKITKENIPAATQLFTPDWIVRYMVENSLGRLWLEGHPDEELKEKWKYYLDEVEQEVNVQVQLDKIREEYKTIKPEEIKVMDCCMGSGHILVYAFDVLVQIYEVYGYNQRDAANSIVENNIFGLDIDERATQLAYFAIMMKARQYDRRFFSRKVQPHVYAICESNNLDMYCIEYFVNGDSKLKADIQTLIDDMHDAKEYGSILNVTNVDFDAMYARFDEIKNEASIYMEPVFGDLLPFIKVAQAMAQKYDVVITNPPYMGSSGMGAKLAEYSKVHYPESKSDLSTIMMEKSRVFAKQTGFISMINIPVWMFISSYERLRATLINDTTFINLLHFGRGVFGSDFGTVAFTLRNVLTTRYKASYMKLYEKQGGVDSLEKKEEWFLKRKDCFTYIQDDFFAIPGAPIAYWVGESVRASFRNLKTLNDVSEPKQGIATADNNRFLRYWTEVSIDKIGFGIGNAEDAIKSGKKWFPYSKGGEFRKWYGNNEFVVNWENDGFEIKHFKASAVRNPSYHLREGITWTWISISYFGARYQPQGFVFDMAGSRLFSEFDNDVLLGYLCSVVADYFLKIINPTINFSNGVIAKLPINMNVPSEVKQLAQDNIKISKADWDSFEASWDFSSHPLVALKAEQDEQMSDVMLITDYKGYVSLIEYRYLNWEIECNLRFSQLKKNEEKLNRIFIDLYGLQDELIPEVEDKSVTVRKANLQREIKSLISYAVGCMFGRYSLDVDGLAYAGGGWDPFKYKTYPADKDNIIPICDDEYFEDDIVGQFVKFIERVYGEKTLEENLKFIADALGGGGSARDVIRGYFINDFYADHCSTYSITGSGKRPIYWLFDSGKKNGFKALIYIHSYQPDTLARMRTDYVHEQQERYLTAITHLEERINNAPTSERVKLSTHLAKLKDQATEIRVFEEKMHHLADQMIRIDLDDGVKKNYEIFKDVLAKIK